MTHTQLGYASEKVNDFSAEELRDYQEQTVLEQLRYCYDNSAFYRQRFRELGIDPEQVKTLEDYRKLPVIMDKEQERRSQQISIAEQGHPFGAHLCVDPSEIGVTATTSGTSGTPTFTYTLAREDMHLGGLGFDKMLQHGGVKQGERVLFAYALGVYATTLALLPIREAGYLPIDVDVRGGAENIINFAELTKPHALMTTPSLAQHLIKRVPELTGKTVKDWNLKALFVVGEMAAGIPETKAALEEAYGCRIYDYIAPLGQGVSFSCDSDEYYGMHAVMPERDLYPMDLIDPETREAIEVTNGTIGEVVSTSMGRKAAPLLRYATGDLIQVFTEPCPGCGFTGARFKIIGRTDDMLIVKGSNIYPAAIKSVLAEFVPEITGDFRIVLTQKPPMVNPPLQMKVELPGPLEENKTQVLAQRIQDRLSKEHKVRPNITWVYPGDLEKPLAKTPFFERQY